MKLASALAGTAVVVLLGAGATGSTRATPAARPLAGHVLPVSATGAPGPEAYGAADTRFGLALLDQLDRGDRTVVISPTSVAGALGMAYLGARGDTATAMARCLSLPGEPTATGTPPAATLAGLRGRTGALRSLPGVDGDDTVWVDPTVQTSPAYLDRVTTAYDTGVRQVPLLSRPTDAADAINRTVAAGTRGRIRRIVTPDQLHDIGWVLTDTVALDARWATPFSRDDTRPGPFRGPHGTVTGTYLHQNATLGYAHRAGWTAVSLPYRGSRLRMLVLLPDGTARAPSPDVLAGLTGSLTDRQVDLALPKVSLSYSRELSEPLRAMGMGPAFDPGADFTGLSPEAGPIRFVEHKATLDVAEQGTHAAAATAVGQVDASAVRKPPARTVTVDHPYLMLIQDTQTGDPLFVSHVSGV